MNILICPTVILNAKQGHSVEVTNRLNIKVSRIATRTFLFNPLKPELNSICYLLALLGAHHFLHVSRMRVKL